MHAPAALKVPWKYCQMQPKHRFKTGRFPCLFAVYRQWPHDHWLIRKEQKNDSHYFITDVITNGFPHLAWCISVHWQRQLPRSTFGPTHTDSFSFSGEALEQLMWFRLICCDHKINEILQCDDSNESFSAVPYCGNVYSASQSGFKFNFLTDKSQSVSILVKAL